MIKVEWQSSCRPAIAGSSTIYHKMEFHPGGRRILDVFQCDGKKIGSGRFNIETGEATKLVTPQHWSRFAISRKGSPAACTVTRDTAVEQGGNNCPSVILVSLPSDG